MLLACHYDKRLNMTLYQDIFDLNGPKSLKMLQHCFFIFCFVDFEHVFP